MASIVLRDSTENDVGFLLVAGDEPLSTLGQRDVVLMSLPLPNPSELAAFVSQYKNSEFSAKVAASAEGYTVAFQVDPLLEVSLQVGANGAGSWSVPNIGAGMCQVLAK